MNRIAIVFLLIAWWLVGCTDDSSSGGGHLAILSKSINGAQLVDGLEGLQVEAEVELVFSAALDVERFTSSLSLEAGGQTVAYDISFANAQSKVIITAMLEYDSEYELSIATRAIGANGESLKDPLAVKFNTTQDQVVRSLPPCTGSGCVETMKLSANGTEATFDFLSSYPIFLNEAHWEKLKYAVIVVHGQNRDADNYFGYLTNALKEANLQDSTVLIAPEFKSQATVGDGEFYWPSSNWREGQPSGNELRLSSFSLVDSLVSQLSDQSKFPILQKIVVTGHSSGGLFTHVYAASNSSENLHSEIKFEYVVANSQYFYYPDQLRYNEQGDSFYEPTDCVGYDFWPFGYSNATPYLDGVSHDMLNGQFAQRSITYFLGNNTSGDGALNTNSCSATLLGSSRYQRGENIFLFMEQYYSGIHNHKRRIVEGVGHDGSAMYQSDQFQTLITDLLN
jgi:hypothetical protein